MKTEDYDALFPEVRAALVTDIGYSVMLAKAAQSLKTRAAAQYARRAAEEAASTPTLRVIAADDVSKTQSASD